MVSRAAANTAVTHRRDLTQILHEMIKIAPSSIMFRLLVVIEGVTLIVGAGAEKCSTIFRTAIHTIRTSRLNG